MNREIHLAYHDECMDGLLGAGILFDLVGGAGLHPLIYPQQLDVLKFNNVDVVFVDYVVPSNVLITLLKQGNRVFCIDHHIASLAVYEEVFKNIGDYSLLANFFVLANTETSGAALCELFGLTLKRVLENGSIHSSKYTNDQNYIFNFDTFEAIEMLKSFKEESEVTEPERLMNYLSNSDTYTYPDSLEKARHIRLGLEHAHEVEPEVNFITYLHLYRRYLNDWSELERIGAEIETEQFPEIDAMVADGTGFVIGFDDPEHPARGEFLVMYAPHAKVNTIAQRVFSTNPKVWFIVFGRVDEKDPTLLNLSMRGRNGSNPFNLSQLGQSLGGGGHFNAAGGRIPNYTDANFRSALEWGPILKNARLPYAGVLVKDD